MNNTQKTTVWFAALNAVKYEKFAVKLCVGADVAKSLGFKMFYDANGFDLYTVRGINAAKKIANAPIVA